MWDQVDLKIKIRGISSSNDINNVWIWSFFSIGHDYLHTLASRINRPPFKFTCSIFGVRSTAAPSMAFTHFNLDFRYGFFVVVGDKSQEIHDLVTVCILVQLFMVGFGFFGGGGYFLLGVLDWIKKRGVGKKGHFHRLV